MYQMIHEKIAVAGVYRQASFAPKKFKWLRREYPIQRITLKSDVKDGGVQKRMYSVVSGGNVYRLVFNRDTEVWWLEEVWIDE